MTPDFDKNARAVFDPLNTQLRGFEHTQAVGDIVRLQVEAWNQALAAADKTAEAWLTGANGPTEVDAFRAALRAKKLPFRSPSHDR